MWVNAASSLSAMHSYWLEKGWLSIASIWGALSGKGAQSNHFCMN